MGVLHLQRITVQCSGAGEESLSISSNSSSERGIWKLGQLSISGNSTGCVGVFPINLHAYYGPGKMHMTKSFRGLAPFSRRVQELCRLLHEWGKGGMDRKINQKL